MSATRLLVMHTAPQDGWESLIGSFWVLMSDGRRLRHITERQTEITITLRKGMGWQDYFEEASDD
jgi:hypothetical protein